MIYFVDLAVLKEMTVCLLLLVLSMLHTLCHIPHLYLEYVECLLLEFYCFVFMAVQLDFIHCLINTFTLGFNTCSDLQESVNVIYFQTMGRVHLSSIITVVNHCHQVLFDKVIILLSYTVKL